MHMGPASGLFTLRFEIALMATEPLPAFAELCRKTPCIGIHGNNSLGPGMYVFTLEPLLLGRRQFLFSINVTCVSVCFLYSVYCATL